ncbi:MAG: glycosyltransferase [Coriobacteriia bacterium]|nr:glycosyltransferase [Coriobacteriia bacterium]
MTMFSIVVPAFNASDTLTETLQAVSAQSYRDWECVVVDDGSTDDTLEIASRFAASDPRFRVISQENRGTGGAYNAGVCEASSEWITICSADDVLLSHHLRVMADAIADNPTADIVSCNGYFYYENGERVPVYPDGTEDSVRSWSVENLLERCFFSVGACYRREWFDTVGGYAEDVFGEDYDFWLRAMARGATHLYIPMRLALHRVTATQKSADHRRAYESDIRSIAALLGSEMLDAHQRRAARAGIRLRRRLISEIGRPVSLQRRVGRRIRKMMSRFSPR